MSIKSGFTIPPTSFIQWTLPGLSNAFHHSLASMIVILEIASFLTSVHTIQQERANIASWPKYALPWLPEIY